MEPFKIYHMYICAIYYIKIYIINRIKYFGTIFLFNEKSNQTFFHLTITNKNLDQHLLQKLIFYMLDPNKTNNGGGGHTKKTQSKIKIN